MLTSLPFFALQMIVLARDFESAHTVWFYEHLLCLLRLNVRDMLAIDGFVSIVRLRGVSTHILGVCVNVPFWTRFVYV